MGGDCARSGGRRALAVANIIIEPAVLAAKPVEFLAGQPIMAFTGIELGLLEPVAQCDIRGAQVCGRLAEGAGARFRSCPVSFRKSLVRFVTTL